MRLLNLLQCRKSLIRYGHGHAMQFSARKHFLELVAYNYPHQFTYTDDL